MTRPSYAWPGERVGQLLGLLAQRLDPAGRAVAPGDPPADLLAETSQRRLQAWMLGTARTLALEPRPVDVRARGAESLLASGGPVLVMLTEGAAPVFVVLLALRKNEPRVQVLAPDQSLLWLPTEEIEERLFPGAASARSLPTLDLALPEALAVRIRSRLGRARRSDGPRDAWVFERAEPSFWRRVRVAGGLGLGARALGGYLAQLAVAVTAWALVGAGALEGRLEPGWLWAWGLMLVTAVGLQGWAAWSAGKLAVTVGGLSKERLLDGILCLEPDEIRSRGVGDLLGSVLEVEALEALARAGGPLAVAAGLQVLVGAGVLALGVTPLWMLALLALHIALLLALGARYHRRLLEWAAARLRLTHELIEAMVGHRTMVAQAPAGQQLDDEGALAAYERRSAALDRQAARFLTLAPRTWLLLGLFGLAPAFVAGRAVPGSLAVSLGGLLLIYWGLRRLVEAAPALAAALLAWQRTRAIFRAADRPQIQAPPVVPSAVDDAAVGRRGLIVGRDLTLKYPARPEPALRGVSFAIRRGERVLVEGPSGSGKSSLGALLAGLRQPSSGVLLFGGFDHHSLGPQGWRGQSAGVPQFHENHVFSAPFVFNVAMGRAWPPRPEDWRSVEEVCGELGLDTVLARMPAGLHQMIGDSGWQLSHGERARLFVARALLQDVPVRILDESFSALDPETLERVLGCVLARTPTLVIIAHP